MSYPVVGTHLTIYVPEGKNVADELETCGGWVATVPGGDFEFVSKQISQCKHKDRHRKLEPVLKELRLKDKVRTPLSRKTDANI